MSPTSSAVLEQQLQELLAETGAAALGDEREFSRLIDEWRAVEWRSGGQTLLAAMGLQFNEVRLCRGLAWLLDPAGGHQLGAHVLNAFLRSLGARTVGADEVQIRVEESREDSRADVVIRAGSQVIVIEAKVLAAEGVRQADRIASQWTGEEHFLVFLTRTGQAPLTAVDSKDLWHLRTWRDLAFLIRDVAIQEGVGPAAGVKDFIETIGAL